MGYNMLKPSDFESKDSPVTLAVIADLRKRDRYGREKHGKPLEPDTHISNLREAYEEALDLAQYLKAELMREGSRACTGFEPD